MSPKIKSHPAAEAEAKITAALSKFQNALTDWFQAQKRDLPWRHTKDPYAILVSEIMLQQTQVITVIDYFNRWMARFPTIAALAAAPEPEVLHAWQGLGYYSRARNLHKAAQKIVADFAGVFPRDPEDIRSLPGVGRYTAGAVGTFAFDLPTPPVDGNIARVIARLLDFREPVDTTAGLEHIWRVATAWQPETGAGLYNEAMMELGALICSPRQPLCLTCPVQAFCNAREPETLPIKKPRRKTVPLAEDCGWMTQDGAVLLELQTGKRWRGLWRLPVLAERPEGCQPLLSLDYPFTHHRITLSVFQAPPPAVLAENQRWVPVSEASSIAMPAPHRRALKRLLEG